MNLKEIRLKNNKTQRQIAKILNVANSTYNGYEKNLYEPNIETLIKLADFYNVTVDEIIGHKKKDNELSSITLSENQKIAINEILRLNDFNILLAIAYCKGLYANQKEC